MNKHLLKRPSSLKISKRRSPTFCWRNSLRNVAGRRRSPSLKTNFPALPTKPSTSSNRDERGLSSKFVTSHTTETFRRLFSQLPLHVQQSASRAYQRWQDNPHHPSLQFKQIHETRPIFSIRIGLHYRALGIGPTIASCGSGSVRMTITTILCHKSSTWISSNRAPSPFCCHPSLRPDSGLVLDGLSVVCHSAAKGVDGASWLGAEAVHVHEVAGRPRAAIAQHLDA